MLKKIVEIGGIKRENARCRKQAFSDLRVRVTVEISTFRLRDLAHRNERKKLP